MSSEACFAQGLVNYKYRDAAKSDIERASHEYHSLRLKLQDFTFENGQTSRLLCLEGTIPVKYMGAVYNIPLAVYFVYQHPYHPPIAYVRPTSSMQIKPSLNVDTNGKIFLPYLAKWEYPGSTTQQLLKILQDVFGTRTPVFAKYPPQSTTTGYVGFNPSLSTSNGSAYADPSPGLGWGGGNVGSAAMPRLPGVTNSVNTTQSSGMVFGAIGMPPVPSGVSPDVVAGLSEEEQMLLSLRSAVQDKLNKRLREEVDRLSGEVQSLQTTERDLSNRATNLEIMKVQMISELDQVRSSMKVLKEKTREYREICRKSNGKEDYDSAVDTTAPVYRQLLEAFAEEQAIGDVLDYLSQAMEKGAIDADDFIKVVRDQSRDQFMKRAMVYKCRAKAGLPST